MIASRPVYDGKKNIYTAQRIKNSADVPLGKLRFFFPVTYLLRQVTEHNTKLFVSQTEVPYTFRETDRLDAVQRSFTIILQPKGEVEIDLSALDTYLKNGTSVDIPSRPIMALETAMKYAAASRFLSTVNKFEQHLTFKTILGQIVS